MLIAAGLGLWVAVRFTKALAEVKAAAGPGPGLGGSDRSVASQLVDAPGLATVRGESLGSGIHEVWLELGMDKAGGIFGSGAWEADLFLTLALGGQRQQAPIVLAYDSKDARVTPRVRDGLVAFPSDWPQGGLVEHRRIYDLPPVPPGTPFEISLSLHPKQPMTRTQARLWIGTRT